MTKLTNPIPLFLDLRGALLDAGRIWVGVAGQDPETHPVQLYWDEARTVPALQPLETMGGRIVNGAYPGHIYLSEENFSMRTRDADGNLVDYSPALTSSTVAYQPLADDLTAIAALTTTYYGRALLTLINQAALREATGIPDPLPAVGGAVSGAITRQSSGRYLHHGDGTLPGDTVTRGTADPTGGTDGDTYFQYSAT
jgi:hypothetical protein